MNAPKLRTRTPRAERRLPATRSMASLASASLAALWMAGCGADENAQQAAAICGAVNGERFEEALSIEPGPLDPAMTSDREIAECRCIAHLSLGDRAACTEEIGPLLASPAAETWRPHPVLGKLMVRTFARAGQIPEAAALAARIADQHSGDFELLQLELRLRSQVEDETRVLEEAEARLQSLAPDNPIPQRLALTLAWLGRAQHERALSVLGETPPASGDRLELPWYETRIQAQAAAGDLGAVQQTFDRWRSTGWDPIDLEARYALRLSVGQLRDPKHPKIDLLRASIAKQDQLQDRHIIWGLHRRLIAELMSSGRAKEALAAYDAAIQVVELPDLPRAQIERAVRGDQTLSREQSAARLRFRLPADAAPAALWLSPDGGEAPDGGYQRFPIAPDRPVETPSAIGLHPRRYVLRGADGSLLGSGSVWPEANATREILLQPMAETADAHSASPAPPPRASAAHPPGDGRRRLFVMLADCGDWRLTEYLRHRGELPFHDQVFREGYRAVLTSRPAFTAAAMKSLVWPSDETEIGTLGWLHQLGLEAAGLESVGTNPLGFLSAVLPAAPSLFDTIGARELIAANMLLAHGRIESGRHAEVIGPHGAHGSLPPQKAFRPLAAEELRAHPALHHDASTKRFAETIAAEMDAAIEVARAGEVDFFFMRIEALDLMTHGHFGPLDGVGQDNGAGPLLDAYRYIDARLAQLHGALDQDDWLVLLSDHGIRSSMQHEEDAIFAVIGEGVPRGRASGQPDLRGVPRTLAAMLGIETDWPDTGAAPWLSEIPGKAALVAR